MKNKNKTKHFFYDSMLSIVFFIIYFSLLFIIVECEEGGIGMLFLIALLSYCSSLVLPEYVDMNIINNVKCDKILVEFLRVNSWIRKWFDIDYSEYTLKQSGYNHLPLAKKKEYISKVTGFKEVSVCEDVTEHYEYWQDNFNHNSNDCCNLRNSKATKFSMKKENNEHRRLF
jgi:hypothetical protein